MNKDEHKVAKEKIEADYKVAKTQCDTLKDNAKDVCQKEAKGKENVAKAELEQQFKPSDSNARKVAEEKVEGHLRSREGKVRRPDRRCQVRLREAGQGRRGQAARPTSRRWPRS